MSPRIAGVSLLILGGVAVAPRALADGALLSGGDGATLEQRTAIAAGADRVTVWTSLRFSSGGGPVGLVIPVPPGASLDYSSDAWLEALEVATAPRILPPDGAEPYCPGQTGGDDPFDMTGVEQHVAGLAADEMVVLFDAPAVETWAQEHGLSLPSAVAEKLGQSAGMRFAAARFTAPTGEAMTPTVRVVMPGATPALPLTLTTGNGEDVRVTTWLIGPGRGSLVGAVESAVAPKTLTWNAAKGKSDYSEVRAKLLSDGGPSAAAPESASHEGFTDELPIGGGDATIPSVVTTYFKRAVSYGDGASDAAPCIAAAIVALDATKAVATACPRAELGVVDGSNTCAESVGSGETDPGLLRCGEGADDLAVAFSGLVPANTWLVRQSLLVRDGVFGVSFPVEFTSAGSIGPVITAKAVDTSQCDSQTTVVAGPSGGDDLTLVDASNNGCTCLGTSDTAEVVDDSTSTATGGVGGGGSGGGSGVGAGQSTGDGEATSGGDEPAKDDSCGSDTSDDDSGCDCGSDTSSDDSGCACGSGSSNSNSGCDCGNGKCSIAGQPAARKRTTTKLSPLALMALAIALPLRRALRRRRPR